MQTRPSRLYLPKFDNSPTTIFEYLIARFPQIPATVWRARVERGLVILHDGSPLNEDSPYRHGVTVFYRKEVASEPASVEEAVIVYQDDKILVVDKPHGMPVTPSGEHVERSLLVSLERLTGFPEISPVHRLDRDTAGLLLFTINKGVRAHYHRLFAQGIVEREYFAVAPAPASADRTRWHVETRLESGVPWYCQRIVPGPTNAISEIELMRVRAGAGLFRLFSKTGRKHQLQVHMASIGCPVAGDPFYPTITKKRDEDPPMQLLAFRLAFIDPLTGTARSFASSRKLVLMR